MYFILLTDCLQGRDCLLNLWHATPQERCCRSSYSPQHLVSTMFEELLDITICIVASIVASSSTAAKMEDYVSRQLTLEGATCVS